jgi:hypothetical protein
MRLSPIGPQNPLSKKNQTGMFLEETTPQEIIPVAITQVVTTQVEIILEETTQVEIILEETTLVHTMMHTACICETFQ